MHVAWKDKPLRPLPRFIMIIQLAREGSEEVMKGLKMPPGLRSGYFPRLLQNLHARDPVPRPAQAFTG